MSVPPVDLDALARLAADALEDPGWAGPMHEALTPAVVAALLEAVRAAQQVAARRTADWAFFEAWDDLDRALAPFRGPLGGGTEQT